MDTVRTDVSEEDVASLKMEETCSSERAILGEPHGTTSQKTAFFIVTIV
jgi:hypothetical protein